MGKKGWLMPRHEEIKSYDIIGFDTEDDTRGNPLSFAFHDGINYFYTVDANKALAYVLNYPKPAIFCAHNLEYDIVNLFKHCNYRYIDQMIYASKLLKVTLLGKKHFFINSHSFFSGSVAKMGQILKIPKLSASILDSSYNIQDAYIVQQFMKKFQDRVNSLGVNLGVSIGQMAMAVFRHSYLSSSGYKACNEKVCLSAYYGGRVEVFYRGEVKDITVADINSCYPYAMTAFEYPDSTFMEHSTLDSHLHGVGKFRIFIPDNIYIPPLPFKSESGRLFFPTGEIEGYWTYAEVREALTLKGVRIIQEYDGIGTNVSCKPFDSFIEYFYNERKTHKEILSREPNNSNSLFESELLKLIQNNLYGKFNQHKDSSVLTRVKLSAYELREKKGTVESKIGPFYSYRFPRETAPSTANYIWGTHVTSYARIHLARSLRKVHESGAKLLYCDTDSIMFSGNAELSYSNNLGDWSKESYPIGVFKQAKGYILFKPYASDLETKEPIYFPSKVACKGVPTSHALDFVVSGMASFVSPIRLKAGLIRQHAHANINKDSEVIKQLGANVWNGVQKEMRSVYIKRIGLHDTRPVNILEIPILEHEAKKREDENEELSFRVDSFAKNDFWRNLVIPSDFKSRPDEGVFFLDYPDESTAPFFLVPNQCIGLAVEDIWFSGDIVDVFFTPKGKQYYKVALSVFCGTEIIGFRLFGLISANYFFNTPKKHLTFLLSEIYYSESTLKVKVDEQGELTPFSLIK